MTGWLITYVQSKGEPAVPVKQPRLLPQPQRWTVEILLLLRREEMGKEDVWVSYRVVEDGASYLPLLVHQVHPSVQLQTKIDDIVESM